MKSPSETKAKNRMELTKALSISGDTKYLQKVVGYAT
jgi:hypothetical protein